MICETHKTEAYLGAPQSVMMKLKPLTIVPIKPHHRCLIRGAEACVSFESS